MTRLYSYILLFCLVYSVAKAQDTIVFDNEEITEQYIEDAEITKKTQAPPPPATVKYVNRKFQPDFKEDYTGSDFNYEPKKHSEKNWFERALEWLANAWRSFWEMLTPSKTKTTTTLNNLLFKIACVLILLTTVYFIARTMMKSSGIWIFGKGNRQLGTNINEIENIHETDFSSLITKTTEEHNYRLAIRFYYLWLLKKLSARGTIHWNQDKTNNDYFYEIKDIQLRDDFKYLSYVYDYIWYGEFEVDNEAYLKAEKAFRKTLNNL